jgi:hypothetical protein
MVKLLKNERKLIEKNGKYIFTLNQEQEYEPETRTNMIAEWKKEIEEKEAWLKNKPQLEKTAIAEVKSQINSMEGKLKTDIRNAKEALKLWENV